MVDDREIRDLIRLVYECSVDARNWCHFLAAYAKALKVSGAMLVVDDLANQNGSVALSHTIDPYWGKRYDEYYVGRNPWLTPARPLMRPGWIFGGEEMVSDTELQKTEFYNDFLKPQDQFYVFGGVVTLEASVSSLLSGIRSKKGGPVQEVDRACARELIPHLQTALRLQQRIAGMDLRLECASSALDYVPGCLIVTDSSGRIVHMNHRAEAFLKSNSGLAAEPDGLHAGFRNKPPCCGNSSRERRPRFSQTDDMRAA